MTIQPPPATPPAQRPRLSVVVPCFNEVETLRELHERVGAVCRAAVGEDYELVLVNDGSTDPTWTVLEVLARDDRHLVAVNLSRNHGHQLALSAGLQVASGERVLLLDADLQDPPELLKPMMEKLDAGCDVAYGLRTGRDGESWFKRASAHFFYRLIRRLVDIDIPADAGDFRLMSRRAVDMLLGMPEQHRFIRGMVSWIGLRQEPVPYRRAARFAGKTKYPLGAMVRFALDAISSFSIKPLRIASYLGAIAAIAAILSLLYVLWGWLFLDVVQGWTSLMVVVLVLNSAQLLVLGVMGEYLGRTYLEAKRRPLFLIDRVVRSAATALRPPP
jgi:dolichol-phosphate mannosyltransferase